jgi:hypothetical protein
MTHIKNEKKIKPKTKPKKTTPPHFVLEVQDSIIGQSSVILPKENPNGNNQSLT